MAEYTTITVSTDLKDELASDMQGGETWNEYLQRLHTDDTEALEPAESDRATGPDRPDLEIIIEEVREAASSDDSEQTDTVDYDRFREIVREEVRRALEDIVR